MSAYPFTVTATMATYAADAQEARERVGAHLAACSFADPVHVDAAPGLPDEAPAPHWADDLDGHDLLTEAARIVSEDKVSSDGLREFIREYEPEDEE